MPQSGDGDGWPTTDDDKQSEQAGDASTHELPVPEKPAAGSWFEPPNSDGGDEPHAKPAQQLTQPMSWPVADLEKQVKNANTEAMSFVRPVATPEWPNDDAPAETGPDWPSEPEDDQPATAATAPTAELPTPADPEPDRTWPDKADESPVDEEPADEPTDQATPAEQDEPAADEPSAEAPADRTVANLTPVTPEPSADPEPDQPPADTTAPEQPPSEPADAVAPDRTGVDQPADATDRSRAGPDRPVEATRPPRPPAGERPRTGPPADATVVNLVRPTPPGPGTDSPTVFFRPTQPPPDQPPSFVRPRLDTYQAPDSATVNIPRPDRKSEWPPPEPPRAAPQRIGPSAEEPSTEEPSTPRKDKKLLVAAIAVVAVLGLAAGVIFFVPGVSDKLGLTGEDPVAIAQPPAPIKYTPGLKGPDANGPAPSPSGVQSALTGPVSNPALGTITGLVIDPATNETLYERESGSAITPASTGKIITAAATLLSLDHTQQLVTKVVQGEQPGEVIIVGGGDPTISSLKVGNESMYPGAAHLSALVDQVKASGVQVTTVYIDQSRYAAPELEPSWLPEDVGAGYIAPIVPAMLDGDRRDATVNYSPRTNDPGATLVNEFATRIGASPAGSIEKQAPANAKVLGEIRSAPVSQLVDNMLDRSENTLGDILAHEVAIQAGQEPSFEGASKAMLDVLRQNNFDVDGVVMRDGSGMSTQNKVSAKLLAQILAVAAGPDGKDPRTDKLRPLLGGLPVAGGSGTLADRYTQGASAEGRGWVRAKTGTLTGVNSLAGIVLDKDNRPLVFAFLTSGTNGNTARPALDTVAAALRGCGCQ